jgi:Trm5-related predicted tRNA methylase
MLERLKELALAENDEGQLLHLREVIYENGKAEFTPTIFEDVAVVLEPAVEETFNSLRQELGSAK